MPIKKERAIRNESETTSKCFKVPSTKCSSDHFVIVDNLHLSTLLDIGVVVTSFSDRNLRKSLFRLLLLFLF